MTRAGIGLLRLIDRDFVELSNLQRQFLFDEADAPGSDAESRRRRAASGADQFRSRSRTGGRRSDPSNAAELFEGIDLILDGTDNFETRYLINDVAVSGNGSMDLRSGGRQLRIETRHPPGAYRVFPLRLSGPPQATQPTCETAGVLGSVTATIAALQVADALKILVEGRGCSGAARLTTVDVWSGEIRQIDPPARDPACPCCARARICVSGRLAPRTHQPVRQQCRADSRAGAPRGSAGTGRQAGRDRAGAVQRIRAARCRSIRMS